MNWALYVLAGCEALGGLTIIGKIGKPVKPLAPGRAAALVLWAAAWVVVLVLAARRLT